MPLAASSVLIRVVMWSRPPRLSKCRVTTGCVMGAVGVGGRRYNRKHVRVWGGLAGWRVAATWSGGGGRQGSVGGRRGAVVAGRWGCAGGESGGGPQSVGLAAGALWDAWIERDAELASGRIVDCGNAAVAELAVRLGCSKTVAQSFAEVGVDLQLRLPVTRAEFVAGNLDLGRVRVICREMAGLSAGTVAALESGVVAAARCLSPGPLAAEIERLIVRHAPDEAAEQRETVQAWSRRVVKRRGRGYATVEVTVSPEEGEALMQLVTEFTRTVCAEDPRDGQEKLVDAVLALAHGEPYLQCRCGRENCAAEGASALPGRRAPLTQITVDLPTLLGWCRSLRICTVTD